MNKRTFIKTTSMLAGAALLNPLSSLALPGDNEHLQNWAGNITYSTGNVFYPSTVEEVQSIVKKLGKLRTLGSRHSFNTIADSVDNLVSLEKMKKIIALDKNTNTVTVEGGIRYGELAPYLHENGYALHNLASLPHISIAGAVATATHGSGILQGNLSSAVSGIEFVNANGDVIHFTKQKDGDIFNGAVVALGALGVVTKVTLNIQPTFNMKQVVYRNLPMSELKNNFTAIENAGYSVSLFTDWNNKNINEVWIKSIANDGDKPAAAELFGAKIATQNLHPIETESAINCTEQMGVSGPWFERMPHFKMGFKPSAGKELQSEFFVPIEHAYDAIMAMESLHEKITPHLFISEIRTIHADELWMSPCYKQTCVALHTTWKQDKEVMDLVPMIEEKLAPFHPKPHWAKIFTMQPDILQSRYTKLDDFKDLVKAHDPNGKFRNDFLGKNLYS